MICYGRYALETKVLTVCTIWAQQFIGSLEHPPSDGFAYHQALDPIVPIDEARRYCNRKNKKAGLEIVLKPAQPCG
jgi:hypothetical protein